MTSCPGLAYRRSIPQARTPLKCSRQSAVSRRQSAVARIKKATAQSIIQFKHCPSPTACDLNPESCFFHNPTYYPSLSSAACQETECPRGAGAAMACPALPCSYSKATSAGWRVGSYRAFFQPHRRDGVRHSVETTQGSCRTSAMVVPRPTPSSQRTNKPGRLWSTQKMIPDLRSKFSAATRV